MARLMMDGGNNRGGGGRKLSFKTKSVGGGGGSGVGASCGTDRGATRVRATRVSLPSGSVQEIASRFNAVIVEGGEARGREVLLKRLQGEGTVKAAVKALEKGFVLVRKPGKAPSSRKGGGSTEVPPKDNKLSIPKDSNILESVLNEAECMNGDSQESSEKKLPAERSGYGKIKRGGKGVSPGVKPNSSSLYKNLPPLLPPPCQKKPRPVSSPSSPPIPSPKPSFLHTIKTPFSVDPIQEDSSLSDPIPDKPLLRPPSPPQSNLSFLYKPPNSPSEEGINPSLLSPRSSFLHGQVIPLFLPPTPLCPGPQPASVSEETDYEDIHSYASISGDGEEEEGSLERGLRGGENEAIYDDIIPPPSLPPKSPSITNSDDIYESVYNLDGGRPSSDSSSYDQTNSLYGARPPSQSSNLSGPAVGGASRSDTSDDWVDLETEEQILVLRGRARNKNVDTWSQQVRRQWSKRGGDFYDCDSDNGSGKHYEAVENVDDDSAVCDDFDGSSDSETSSYDNEFKVKQERPTQRPISTPSEGIYGLMKEAGKKVRKTSWSIGQSLRRISRISVVQTNPSIENGDENNISRGKWSSLKKFKQSRKSMSTFYLEDVSKDPPPQIMPPKPKTESVPDVRRLSTAIRPSSPPPPPPPLRMNGEYKKKTVNDTTWYSECGLFDSTNSNGEILKSKTSSNSSWYSDIGLYEKNRPSDTSSDRSSSQGSDLNLRFADEPLYQFYAANVAELERTDYYESSDYDYYEEIGTNGSENNITLTSRPTALELVVPGIHRTLWCQVPQVISSRILDSLTTTQLKLQEAKFEVMTSEASYYKSLAVLEKHFANSSQMKDESVISKMDYKILFSNVVPVRKCSEAVLEALDKCWQESILLEGICDLIYDLCIKHFQTYIKYCTNQISIETTLKRLKNGNIFAEALSTLESSPKCQNLTLYSFLLLPLQRVTRMPLLLDAILTKLDPEKSEYDSCRLALAHLNKIVHECNEAARRAERYEEMAFLSRCLSFPSSLKPLPLLSASRWLVRSSQVTQINLDAKLTFSRKLTNKNTKLTLFLFTDYLIVAKKKGEDHYNVIDYCGRSLVQMSEIEDAVGNRFMIMLTMLENHEGKTQEMVLCCGSESSRERWLQAVSSPSSNNPDETLYADWDCPQVSSTHSFIPSQPDELLLQTGDVVNVQRKLNDGWYYGERIRDGEKGWFPGNHTVEIASQHVRARNLKQRYRLLALSANYLQQQKLKY